MNDTIARVLTEGVIIDQLERILESALTEQPLSPQSSLFFSAYDLIRSPPSECRAILYSYLNAWNRLRLMLHLNS